VIASALKVLACTCVLAVRVWVSVLRLLSVRRDSSEPLGPKPLRLSLT
jgi:hypothetical protein